MKRSPPDRKAQAKRAALSALKRVRRQAERAQVELPDSRRLRGKRCPLAGRFWACLPRYFS